MVKIKKLGGFKQIWSLQLFCKLSIRDAEITEENNFVEYNIFYLLHVISFSIRLPIMPQTDFRKKVYTEKNSEAVIYIFLRG